jgi:tRNA (cytidine/uridine-2'-O-)-methyltransferase
MLNLPDDHRLRVVLVHPQIAPNTGNIARLCVATGCTLHLVRPMGFVLDDRQLRRSAMDYWPRLHLTIHDDVEAFLRAATSGTIWLFSSRGQRGLWQGQFRTGDWLVFGSETAGLPTELLAGREEQTLRIPQAGGERCLNLSTSAGIGVYEAIRQICS